MIPLAIYKGRERIIPVVSDDQILEGFLPLFFQLKGNFESRTAMATNTGARETGNEDELIANQCLEQHTLDWRMEWVSVSLLTRAFKMGGTSVSRHAVTEALHQASPSR
jgi:hypothetical protein